MAVVRSELLGARPREADREVRVVSSDRFLKAGPLLVGEPLSTGAQQLLDAVERVSLVPAVAQSLLLHSAAALINRLFYLRWG